VLQVITTSARRGAEIFAVALGEALDRRGCACATVALVPGEGTATLDVPALGGDRLGTATLRSLRRELREADVVIAHGSTTLPASVLAALGTGVPVVYRSIGDLSTWNSDWLRRWRTRVLLGRTAAVVVLTERAVPPLTKFAVPAERVVVIPNGVPEIDYPLVGETVRSRARAELGLGAVPVAAFVGALEPEKDAATAIRTVALTQGFHLIVAGDGRERTNLERLALEIAPGRVHFLGQIASSAPVLAAASVLILPSRTEGVPAVAIEAGLTGIPTVASAVGFVDDVVQNGVTGYLLPPGDVAAFASALVSATSQREELGAAARKRCLARFSMDAIAQAWTTLLRRTMRDRASIGTWRAGS
jgi:glycosyltransferase involved in cell wall biosynthesis